MNFALKALLFLFASVLFVSINALGQTTAPARKTSPTPPDDVVRISTNLIRIDVSITDSKGKPVTDLKKNEIEIYENGEKQTITEFTFVSSGRIVSQSKENTAKGTQEVPPPPAAPPRAGDVRRTVALIVDDLALSFESVHFTKRALRKFVDEQMQEGDLVAIVRTGAGVGALQQFTTDKRMLRMAIDKLKWNPMGSGGISAFERFTPTALESQQNAGDSTITDEDLKEEQDRIKAESDARNSRYATGTLGAIRYVINGMTQLPGRKAAVLFSDGFQLTVTDQFGREMPSNILEPLRQLIDFANRASVVIYTMDARGLQDTGLTAADWVVTRNPDAFRSKVETRREQLLDTQAGLAFLADGTGGIAIKNQNDLNLGLERVLEDQSYYLIGYEPDTETFDPATRKFNNIKVNVLRKGVSLRHRSGFFNTTSSPDPHRVPTAGTLTAVQRLEKAIYSPFVENDISLRLNTLFGTDETNSAFVRSLLHIDANNLMFVEEKDGTKKAVFSVLAASFGEDGAIVDQLGKSFTMTIPPEYHKRLLTEGILYHFKFPIKKPGAYQYRVAIRDSQNRKVGSASQFIEVPDLKKNRLSLSSLIIENMTAEEWNRGFDLTAPLVPTNPMSDTALRRAAAGTVLRWGLEIYNAKLRENGLPDLTTRVRVFREGKLVLEGNEKPFELSGQTDMTHLKTFGAISIGKQMEPGDYILQVIVTDKAARARQNIASQYVQFEVFDSP